MSQHYNPEDYYLIVFIDTGEIYEEFRNIGAADIFLSKDILKNDLKVIKNPKYIVINK